MPDLPDQSNSKNPRQLQSFPASTPVAELEAYCLVRLEPPSDPDPETLKAFRVALVDRHFRAELEEEDGRFSSIWTLNAWELLDFVLTERDPSFERRRLIISNAQKILGPSEQLSEAQINENLSELTGNQRGALLTAIADSGFELQLKTKSEQSAESAGMPDMLAHDATIWENMRRDLFRAQALETAQRYLLNPEHNPQSRFSAEEQEAIHRYNPSDEERTFAAKVIDMGTVSQQVALAEPFIVMAAKICKFLANRIPTDAEKSTALLALSPLIVGETMLLLHQDPYHRTLLPEMQVRTLKL